MSCKVQQSVCSDCVTYEKSRIKFNTLNTFNNVDLDGEGINAFTLIACPESYRIKPEAKYRHFKNAEECWQEMLKHQPFGWVKTDSGYEPIWHVNEGDDFNATFLNSTFADGTPFGIKEEE